MRTRRPSSEIPDEERARNRAAYLRRGDKVKAYRQRNRAREAERARLWRESNSERDRANGATWRRANPERVRASVRTQRLKRYGMTPASWDVMFAAQGECCAVCRTREPGSNGRWHIDHDHVTGRVRGILCLRCNMGIGQFADDPDRLRAAALYLETHK